MGSGLFEEIALDPLLIPCHTLPVSNPRVQTMHQRVSTCGLFCVTLMAILCQPNLVFGVNRTAPNPRDQLPDCLGASAQQSAANDGNNCNRDLLSIAQQPVVAAAENILGLTPADVEFVGCRNEGFITRIGHATPRLTLRITYPIIPNVALSDYVAPIVHELGHVYQLKQAGSFDRLEQQLNPYHERAELGADFLTGVILRTLNLPTSVFELSEYLPGSYRTDLDASHGLPHQRTGAFRLGYFYDQRITNIDKKYSYFQDDLFATLKPNL
jgi:hypothetical protein